MVPSSSSNCLSLRACGPVDRNLYRPKDVTQQTVFLCPVSGRLFSPPSQMSIAPQEPPCAGKSPKNTEYRGTPFVLVGKGPTGWQSFECQIGHGGGFYAGST